MSDQPGPSNQPAPNAPSARTIRDRRPTNLPSTNLLDPHLPIVANEVRILRPSQVPQRLPLAEYTEPEARRILPRQVPMDELGELEPDNIQPVVISNTISAEQQLLQAHHSNGLISFRSTNFVEPVDRSRSQSPETEPSFMERNEHFLGRKVHGCTAFKREDLNTVWDVIIEAPVPSIYEGSVFFVEFHFNPTNSYLVPAVKFKTLMFHPSLRNKGDYDMRGLAQKWGPAATIETIYEYLVSDMRDLKDKIYKKSLPQIEAMAQPNIARLAAGDWEKFETIARTTARKMSGAHVNRTGTTSEAVLMPKFSLREGFARAPSPDIDVVEL